MSTSEMGLLAELTLPEGMTPLQAYNRAREALAAAGLRRLRLLYVHPAGTRLEAEFCVKSAWQD